MNHEQKLQLKQKKALIQILIWFLIGSNILKSLFIQNISTKKLVNMNPVSIKFFIFNQHVITWLEAENVFKLILLLWFLTQLSNRSSTQSTWVTWWHRLILTFYINVFKGSFMTFISCVHLSNTVPHVMIRFWSEYFSVSDGCRTWRTPAWHL